MRHVDHFEERHEDAWPIARTRWTKLYLDVDAGALLGAPPPAEGRADYDPSGDGLTFTSAPFERETEITGPLAARLFVASSTSDADVFAVLRAFGPDGAEVVFQGAIDPHTPLAQGWLRASHRALDPELTTDYRPYHTHAAQAPLGPGEVVQLDVELWPTSIVLPAGYRLALSVRGNDYRYAGPSGGRLSNFKNELTGCGPFLHDDPRDRSPAIFGGSNSLYAGPGREAYLLVPIVPPRE